MPTSEQQRRAIAFLVRSYRATVYGANAWDETGILAALGKVRGMECGMVTVAAMRAAADASLKTPHKIGDTRSGLYAEQVGPPSPRRHPSPEDACKTCGRDYNDEVACCDRPTRQAAPVEDYATAAAEARALLREAEKTRPTPEARPIVRDERADHARTELAHPIPHATTTPEESK